MKRIYSTLLLLLLLLNARAEGQFMPIGVTNIGGIISNYGMINQALYDSIEASIKAVAPNTGFAYRMLPNEGQMPTAIASGVSAINNIRFYRFRLPLVTVLASLHFNLAVGGVGKFVSVAIYDFSGTQKIVDTGAMSATGAGIRSKIFSSPSTLLPGDYILAWTSDAIGVQFSCADKSTVQNAVLNSGVPQIGLCGASSIVGVLPASLGVLTGFDYAIPIIKLQQ